LRRWLCHRLRSWSKKPMAGPASRPLLACSGVRRENTSRDHFLLRLTPLGTCGFGQLCVLVWKGVGSLWTALAMMTIFRAIAIRIPFAGFPASCIRWRLWCRGFARAHGQGEQAAPHGALLSDLPLAPVCALFARLGGKACQRSDHAAVELAKLGQVGPRRILAQIPRSYGPDWRSAPKRASMHASTWSVFRPVQRLGPVFGRNARPAKGGPQNGPLGLAQRLQQRLVAAAPPGPNRQESNATGQALLQPHPQNFGGLG
jgi:hypothetical protein